MPNKGFLIDDSKKESQELLVPKRLQIETIFGCNAKCTMCAVSLPATRKKGIMKMDMFRYIVDSMTPYHERVEKVDLFGLGEPLLDPYIFDRIRYMKERGFRNLAISTNAELMDTEQQRLLLETGIETMIFSIDGVKKETHEAIRRGLLFERVIENSLSMIRMRDETDSKTRFVVRFIRQPSNKSEWVDYLAFWRSKLSWNRGDLIIAYDVNTMGGEIMTREDILGDYLDEEIEKRPCYFVFDRMIILNDGTVPICCEDTPRANFVMGHVKDSAPMDIFNGETFQRIRDLHLQGKKNELTICQGCTVLYSEGNEEIFGIGRRSDNSSGTRQKPVMSPTTLPMRGEPIRLITP